MFRKKITALITLTSLLFATSNVQAQDDMKGSADHPEAAIQKSSFQRF